MAGGNNGNGGVPGDQPQAVDPNQQVNNHPAQALDPNQPAQALDPNQPAQALDPNQPAQALDPNQPAQALDPNQPAQALDPNQPAQALDPNQPAQALDPNQPAQALDPNQPAQALDPNQPAQALDPNQPAQALDPNQPENQNHPPQGVVQNHPAQALDPNQPVNPNPPEQEHQDEIQPENAEIDQLEDELQQRLPNHLENEEADLEEAYVDLDGEDNLLAAQDAVPIGPQDAQLTAYREAEKKLLDAYRESYFDGGNEEKKQEYLEAYDAFEKVRNGLDARHEKERKKSANKVVDEFLDQKKEKQEFSIENLRQLCSDYARYDANLMNDREAQEFRKRLDDCRTSNRDGSYDRKLLDLEGKLIKKIGEEYDENRGMTPKLSGMCKAARAIDGVLMSITRHPLALIIAMIAMLSSPMLLAGFAVMKAMASKQVEKSFDQLPKEQKLAMEKKSLAKVLHKRERDIPTDKVEEMLEQKSEYIRNAAEIEVKREKLKRTLQDLAGRLNKGSWSLKQISGEHLQKYFEAEMSGDRAKFSKSDRSMFEKIDKALEKHNMKKQKPSRAKVDLAAQQKKQEKKENKGKPLKRSNTMGGGQPRI